LEEDVAEALLTVVMEVQAVALRAHLVEIYTMAVPQLLGRDMQEVTVLFPLTVRVVLELVEAVLVEEEPLTH